MSEFALASGEDFSTYKDESDIFFEDPVKGLLANQKAQNASRLVLFEALLPAVEPTLLDLGFRHEAAFFNSHFHDDSRRRGQVLVWTRHNGVA